MKNNRQISNKIILSLVLFLCALLGFSQTTRTFGTSTTSGTFTFTVPAGVTSVTAELWGAGGGGSNRAGAAGGGGGAYTRSTAQTVTGGTAYTVTVGSGGALGLPTAAPGNFSRMIIGVNTFTANGGLSVNSSRTGGAGGTAQTVGGIIAAAWRGGAGGAARIATGGSSDGNEAGGGGGGSALTTAIGGTGGTGNGVVDVATLGGTGTGAGGQGACPNDGDPDAANGLFPGGGGGGRGEGTTVASGGTSKTGANGRVTVTWICPTYGLTAAATATGPFCGASTSVVTLYSTSLVTSGNYLVTYDLTGATVSSGNTATMSFNAATDIGTFTTATLNAGTTNITITSIASYLDGFAACSTTISNFNTTSVTVNTTPTAVAGTAIATCSTSGAVNITAGSNATNQASITWTSSGTGTFTNPTSLTTCTYNPSPADIRAGSVTLTLTAVGNTPCSNVTNTKILTISQPMTANAGTAITTCSNSGAINITAGSSATNQTSITWTSNGTGIFTDANSLSTCTYNPSLADITAGSVTITLTATNAGCTNVISTKTLTITALPTAIAGTDFYICSDAGTVNITAGSSATNYSSVLWTSSGTGILTNDTSLTTCTYTPSIADIAAGNVTLRLTANGNAPCGNVGSTKILTISSPMTADAGSAIITCSNSGAVNITTGSSATNQTSITWTSNGTGTFSNANSLTTCTYTPSVADITVGNITLTLTASNVGCTDVIATKTLTITPLPTANAGTAITTCSNSGTINITTGANATNYTNITWTSSGTGTFANATSLTNCTYTPSVTDIATGSITLTLTVSNTSCTDVIATKTLIINSLPTVDAGTTITTCSNSGAVNITAGATATNYTGVTWSSSGTGTFANATSLTSCTYAPSVADITAGNVTLTLTASNTSCTDVIATKILTINALATDDAGTAITTCSNSGAINITAGASATNYTGVIWSSSGTGTFANATSLTS